MTNPKITVVIPCYNVQDYVSSCLDSIINNSFKDLEILCINDKSTDDTLSILQNYAKKDKRIKIINLSKNKGVGFARNIGLSESQGEWISFIDPDDYIDSQFYEKLYNKALEDKNADVIKAGITINDVSRKTTFKSSLNQRILKHKFYFFGEHTTALYKVSFLKKNNLSYPENIKTGQDVCFISSVILHTDNIHIVDDVYYNYTYNRPGSLDSKVLSHDKIVSRLQMLDYKVNLLNQYHFLSKEDRTLFCEQQIMNHWNGLIHKTDNKADQKLVFGWLVNNKNVIGNEILKNIFDTYQLEAINHNNFNCFMMNPKNYKIFYKEKLKNGRRHIYLFGIKIFSYKKTNKKANNDLVYYFLKIFAKAGYSIVRKQNGIHIKGKDLYFVGISDNTLWTGQAVLCDREYDFNSYGDNFIMIDIGLNIGMTSLWMARKDFIKKIYAFEPFAPTMEQARENFKLNKKLAEKIKAFDFGLSDRDDIFSVPYNPNMPGSMSSIKGKNPKSGRMEKIKLKPASQVLRPIFDSHPNEKIMLKIDCEGGEREILPDLYASGLLQRASVLIMEYHDFIYEPLMKLLKDAGFEAKITEQHDSGVGMIRAEKR